MSKNSATKEYGFELEDQKLDNHQLINKKINQIEKNILYETLSSDDLSINYDKVKDKFVFNKKELVPINNIK